jgi:anti-sigma B factor antagonist
MEITSRDEQGVAVVEVQGEFDGTHSPTLHAVLERLLHEGQRRIVINLQGVEFIDSSGLATLVGGFKRVRREAAKICFASLQPAVRRIFELTRLERAVEIQPDVAQAIQFLTTSQMPEGIPRPPRGSMASMQGEGVAHEARRLILSGLQHLPLHARRAGRG